MAIREVAGADVSSTTPIAQIGAHFTGCPRRAGHIGAVHRRSILPPAPFFAATWALANWGDIGFVIELTNDEDLMVKCFLATLAFGLLVGVIKEIKGDHHAYGGPVQPSRPSAPSP